MPTLAQMIRSANQASYWSREADEVLRALDFAQRRVYFAVTKELRESFLKFDRTTIQIVPQTSIYTLPADFGEMKQLSERVNSALPWRTITPADLNDRTFLDRQRLYLNPAAGCGPPSDYEYAGPYLDGTKAQAGATVWNIELAPMPQVALQCQIIYVAKYVPITSAQSFLVVPDEGRDAVEAFAIAELTRRNSDGLSQEYEQRGQRDLDLFLTWLRDRQVQAGPTVEPYVSDLD